MSFRPKIIVTDDETRMADSLKILLGNEGYEVETFYNGRDALAYIDANDCDLVLMDVMMPVMDGFEALAYLKVHHPDLTVILMTGQASIDSAVTALRSGAYDYLCKPFDFDELIKKVDNALSHRRLLKEKNEISLQLQTTQAHYQYLVNNSPDIIFSLGPGTEFFFVTDKIGIYAAARAQDLLGCDFTSIVHPQDAAIVREYFKEVRSGGAMKDLLELRLKCKACDDTGGLCAGSHALMEMKAVAMACGDPADTGHPASEVYGIMRDITRRRRDEEEKQILEGQLRQAQKMEAIGTLAGGIAHDFNNLLMAMQGNISLLLMQCDASHPYHARLKKIEKHIENGSKLTSQLLGYARKGKYEVKPMDLNRVIEETVQTFSRMRKEIRFYLEPADDLAAIDAESGQLVQILMNLFLNASDAMPGGGDITVTTKNVDHGQIKSRLYKPNPGRYVQMSIRDTGCGMDEQTRERIFEPFFTTKEMGRGTGLGLASVYGIIKGHRGFIEVDSAVSGGTTFHIFFPSSKHAVQQTILPDAEVIHMGHGTIILVDDEEWILEVGKPMIESLGYQVLTARTGAEAVDLYKKKREKIDLVLLDMIMPGMSGGKIYDHLKGIDPGVKVILISGYNVESEAKEILSRGCNGFIQKPFKMKELSRKIHLVIHDRRNADGTSAVE